MSFRGRPLRFVAIALLGWTGARFLLIEPFAGVPEQRRRPSASEMAVTAQAGGEAGEILSLLAPVMPMRHPSARPVTQPFSLRPPAQPRTVTSKIAAGLGGERMVSSVPNALPQIATGPTSPSALPVARDAPGPRPRRWSGYGYVFARPGGGDTALSAGLGQLGGSQAGFRLDYALIDGLALSGRVSAPLESARDREAALGFRWRPGDRAPVTLYAERRVSLGRGGRNAFALMATGGVGPVALPAGFRVEAYGQAGVVGLKRRDVFVEGQLLALRELGRRGRATLTVGGGAWGSVQPGVERIDIGPRARLGFDLGESRSAGLSLDYRHRVVGDARPGSGVALTLDTSF